MAELNSYGFNRLRYILANMNTTSNALSNVSDEEIRRKAVPKLTDADIEQLNKATTSAPITVSDKAMIFDIFGYHVSLS